MTAVRAATRLRELLAGRPGPIVVPGCYDALGARLIEHAGFDAAYMTGFGTAAALLGAPDVGLLGMGEMVDNARRIVAATRLPIVADADTGYGNPLSVMRTVESFEQAGVAGIHLEDQVMPKRCGHMDGKAVVPVDDMVAKVRAALDARSDPDFVVIARTDARAVEGLAAALDRADAYRAAGADMLFIEALETPDELAQAAERFAGTPLLFNWVEGGKTPRLTYAEIADLGYSAIILPVSILLASARATVDVLARLRHDLTPADTEPDVMGFHEFTSLMGLDEIDETGRRYATDR